MKKLQNFLKELLNEKIQIHTRLKDLFDKNNPLYIKGIGKTVVTPILHIAYPNKYGVWNSRSEEALKQLNLFPKFKAKDSFADKYLKVNDILLELAIKYNISLWNLDGIFGDITGDSPFEAKSFEEEVEEDAEEHGITDIVNFGMEKHLEDFIIENWDKTVFGKKYTLIEEEGDIVSQQYQTATGLIDILAKSKDDSGYLVIELKKGRPSDAVVGQILRYMSWVKESMAKGKPV